MARKLKQSKAAIAARRRYRARKRKKGGAIGLGRLRGMAGSIKKGIKSSKGGGFGDMSRAINKAMAKAGMDAQSKSAVRAIIAKRRK